MGSAFNRNNAIIFTSRITDDVISFRDDMKKAGYDYPIVVSESIGCKIDGVVSLYDCFCISDSEKGHGLNSLNLPLYGDEYDFHLYAGDISQLFVNGNVIMRSTVDRKYIKGVNTIALVNSHKSDCDLLKTTYTSTGRVLSRLVYDNNGKLLATLYFDKDGNIVIYKDHINKSLRLRTKTGYKYFKSIIDFFKYSLTVNGFEKSSIIFDMLTYDSMVVGELNDCENAYVCLDRFVSNNIVNDINNIASKNLRNCKHILVRHSQPLNVISSAKYASNINLKCVYPIAEKNTSNITVHKSVGIFIDSSSMNICANIVKSLPNVMFYGIMSEPNNCFYSFNDMYNIKLYMCDSFISKEEIAKQLQDRCSVFVDMNASSKNFYTSLQDCVILCSNNYKGYYPDLCADFAVSEEECIEKLSKYFANSNLIKQDIEKQRSCADRATIDDYKHVFDNTGTKDCLIAVSDLIESCLDQYVERN